MKFVDFQLAQYESFVHDIIFFLFSSVDSAVLENDFESFLKIYYDAFIHNLEEVQINTDDYSYDGWVYMKCFLKFKKFAYIDLHVVL